MDWREYYSQIIHKLHTFVKIIRLNSGKRLNFVIYPTNIADLWQILVYFAGELKGLG